MSKFISMIKINRKKIGFTLILISLVIFGINGFIIYKEHNKQKQILIKKILSLGYIDLNTIDTYEGIYQKYLKPNITKYSTYIKAEKMHPFPTTVGDVFQSYITVYYKKYKDNTLEYYKVRNISYTETYSHMNEANRCFESIVNDFDNRFKEYLKFEKYKLTNPSSTFDLVLYKIPELKIKLYVAKNIGLLSMVTILLVPDKDNVIDFKKSIQNKMHLVYSNV